jgi:hypothetical protein
MRRWNSDADDRPFLARFADVPIGCITVRAPARRSAAACGGGVRSRREVNMLRIEPVELPLVPVSAVYKGL